MEINNLEDAVPMDILMRLFNLRFIMTNMSISSIERNKAQLEIIDIIKTNSMSAYLNVIDNSGLFEIDSMRLKGSIDVTVMEKENKDYIDKINKDIQQAIDNEGEYEVNKLILKKSDYYYNCGDLDNTLQTHRILLQHKSTGINTKMHIFFQQMRLGFCFLDTAIIVKAIQQIHKISDHIDWEQRNRLKVYEGLYCICIRDFKKGVPLLLDCLCTFAATELINMSDFIEIVAIGSLIVLPRTELKSKIIDNPEIIAANIGITETFIQSIYNCKYNDFFPMVSKFIEKLHQSSYLNVHINYIFRELRVLIFNQYLYSYSTVTMKSFAKSFGITVNAVDELLSNLIANGRLRARIDKVKDVIILTTYKNDPMGDQYSKLLKRGDYLVSRVQHLARLIESYDGEEKIVEEVKS